MGAPRLIRRSVGWLAVLGGAGVVALLPATADVGPRATAAREVGLRPAPVPAPSVEPPETVPDPPREAREPDPESLPPARAYVGERSVARGTVVDDTGAPVASGRIRGMRWRAIQGPRRWAVRGHVRDGAFVVRCKIPPFMLGPPPNEGKRAVSFGVEAPGYAWEVFELDAVASATLVECGTVGGIRLVLQRGAVVEGTVCGPDGAPAAGVEVGVVKDPRDRRVDFRTRRKSDEHGRFRLTEIDPRLPLWLHARADGLIARRVPLGTLAPDAVHGRDLRLERVRPVDVAFELDRAESGIGIWIDGVRSVAMENGFREVRLDSGPHKCVFKRDKAVAKVVRLWLDPEPPLRRVRVSLD